MIRVRPAKEPASFDKDVRQKGLDAIAELVGEKPRVPRPGPKRAAIAQRREDIPGKAFPPYWTEALPDMLYAYKRLCAYLSLYIESGTGAPSVDHMVAKSHQWSDVYEWKNYRLACSLVNSRKSNVPLALDPFEIKEGWFGLEFVAYQVIPGPKAVGKIRQKVEDTIRDLRLNEKDCRDAREEYVKSYTEGDITIAYLKRRAPFVAMEMSRNRMLRPGDSL